MCGIGGCVAEPGTEPDRAALERMAHALGHRGPDDSGIEIAGAVGLVHTRLAIVDPSPLGHQPMRHRDGGWLLTYNGEIFNHLELRGELSTVPYAGGTDTETLLEALVRWGEDAIPRCNGLYALAALDQRTQRLLLVRDRFGVKPLYLARRGRELWFASEMKALLAAGLSRRPRPDLVRHAVAHGWVNGRRTPLEGIDRVMPGTIVSVDLRTGEARERTWYRAPAVVDAERGAALARRGRQALADELEGALRTAVRRRLMADVPVGAMCSGGLDSSVIAALAREEQPGIKAFNASVVDQPEVDEGPWARRVADALGIELHTVELTAASWRADLVETVLHTEYPLTHESSVPMAQIAALARAQGIKVLLSGEGADELLGGYEWVEASAGRDFAARGRAAEYTARMAYRWLQRRGLGRRARDPRGRPARGPAAFERRVLDEASAAYRHHRGARRSLEAGCLANLGTYLPHLLNRQDKNTMQRSIETRVPFLDPDVVSLALNLPLEARVEPRRKGVLRDVGRRHLPAAIPERAKVGFGFDGGTYITEKARPEFLAEGRLRDLFGVAREEWGAATSGLTGTSVLWFWSGEIWCRAFLEGHARETIEADLWREGLG